MGRLIDADKVRYEYIHAITLDMDASDMLNMLCDIIDNAPTVEAIPKNQYENRLKADLVAMLTEIQLEIDEKATELCDSGWWLTYNDIIQEKIDAIEGKINNE